MGTGEIGIEVGTVMERVGSIGSGLGALGGKDPLRGVRAKREADEAGRYCVACGWMWNSNTDLPTFLDKEYRKGVHWLETLRLRRMKILEAGYMV
jgi:hypothetical protein